MEINVSISNYRCFTYDNPAKFKIQDSIIAFVGPNNAGKSTVLRFLYEFRNLFGKLTHKDGFESGLIGNQAFEKPPKLDDFNDIFTKLNDRPIKIEIEITDNKVPNKVEKPGNVTDEMDVLKKMLIEIQRNSLQYKISVYEPNGRVFQPHEPRIKSEHFMYSHSQPRFEIQPMMDVFKKLHNTIYIGPFRNLINIGTKEDYFDITIGQKFIEQWNELERGKQSDRRNASRKVIQEIKALFGFSNFNIGSSSDNQNMIVDIDGHSYLLTELGSGLAHFIIVLVTCTIKSPEFILIDEPELNLHPSIQLSFLTTLASKAKSGILFSTHSIGLARSGAELIYSTQRKSMNSGSTLKEFEATENASEFLGEMSYSGYEDLGFEKILLVEGTTDIKTFQQFLRKLGLDNKVVILPLGGSSLINDNRSAELKELTRISGKIYAIVDSEREREGAAMAENVSKFKKMCSGAGIDCCILERRAIENYLSENAVQKTWGADYRALAPYEKLAALGNKSWKKNNNWKVVRNMEIVDIENTDLHEFLLKLR